jgi:hypothetical protein
MANDKHSIIVNYDSCDGLPINPYPINVDNGEPDYDKDDCDRADWYDEDND